MKRKKVKRMATSTFNKRIVLGRKAAKIMADELNRDYTPERPKNPIKVMTKEEMESWCKKATSK